MKVIICITSPRAKAFSGFTFLSYSLPLQAIKKLEMNTESLNSIIRNRRSIYPKQYSDKPIEPEVLNEILENANWAPNHKKTEPWRFIIFEGDNRQYLSDYLGNYYLQQTPEDKRSDIKLNKIRIKPVQASVVIAICMQRDPDEKLPEWEELAAVSAAVQNMWLTCTANGIGAYWSSPSAIIKAEGFLQLREGERCLGLFYMGYADGPVGLADRKPIDEKVRRWKPA